MKRNNVKTNAQKTVLKDKKGSIFTGLSMIMVASFLIIAIIVLNVAIESNSVTTEVITNDNFKYIIDDYKRNIPILARSSTEELSEKIILNINPVEDGSNEIKRILQKKLDEKNENYKVNNNVSIISTVLSIKSSDDPFYIEIKTSIEGSKDNLKYNEIITSKFPIKGLKDPIPFIMCGNHPTFSNNSTKIHYKESLKNYFDNKGLSNSSAYENATSPYIIKKCPFDPYVHHGDGLNMKNCIENGYYHESADGSCYLCRLEGKGFCYHYGFETFIVPHVLKQNETVRSICSSDHVVFGEDNYPGNSIIFYVFEGISEILILDNGHISKYGLT